GLQDDHVQRSGRQATNIMSLAYFPDLRPIGIGHGLHQRATRKPNTSRSFENDTDVSSSTSWRKRTAMRSCTRSGEDPTDTSTVHHIMDARGLPPSPSMRSRRKLNRLKQHHAHSSLLIRRPPQRKPVGFSRLFIGIWNRVHCLIQFRNSAIPRMRPFCVECAIFWTKLVSLITK